MEKKNKEVTRGKGFTLIELLVVVLIIGILAAIALPQYQKIIMRQRLSTYESMLRPVAEASRICRLGKGAACSAEELDVKLPSSCPDLPGYFSGCNLRRCSHVREKSGELFCVYDGDDNLAFGYGLDVNTTCTEWGFHAEGLLCWAGDVFTAAQCRKLGFTHNLCATLYYYK